MTDVRWNSIEEVRAEAVVCCRCDLCYGRTHVVFGEGPPDARLMIVGEAPGEEEDSAGRPFVGKAGRSLDKLLEEAGLDREAIWITNIVRCRPTAERDGKLKNRSPKSREIQACDIWMSATYRLVAPELVLCLGGAPAQALISKSFRIGEGRGKWYQGREGTLTTATYHPGYIPREARSIMEGRMLDDLAMVRSELGKLKVMPTILRAEKKIAKG